nr:unnamed protein product [Callosobruchus analis]
MQISKILSNQKKGETIVKSSTILNEVKEGREAREKQFAFLQRHLKKAEDQRERVLAILGNVVDKKGKEKTDSD